MQLLKETLLALVIVTLAFLAGVFFGVSTCHAQTTVGAHIGTYHVDRKAGYDEFNPGLYVKHDIYTAGVYHNSEGGTSYYAGFTHEWKYVGVTWGLIGGYKRGTMPMLVPHVKLGSGFRLAFLPPIPGADNNTAGLHLMKDF
jgi:hypothetical protein